MKVYIKLMRRSSSECDMGGHVGGIISLDRLGVRPQR
jgi:hypothetical protein